MILLVLSGAALADTVRIATYNANLTRGGPGLVLQAIRKGVDPQVTAATTVLAQTDADIILITGIDFDAQAAALTALSDHLPKPYPFHLALRPNSGLPTGLDLDHNGKLGEPRDAMAYGRFAGAGGMAILSRYPIDDQNIRAFTDFLWKDLPNADLPPDLADDAKAIQRLSTSGHYDVPILVTPDHPLHLLVWSATPPVFDGPDDRNGRRNADETAFWLDLLHGTLPFPPPAAPFILLGETNLDPVDGSGRHQPLRDLITLPTLQDPKPRGTASRSDAGQTGDPALDTAFYPKGVGGLRVDMILPSANLHVTGSGVIWPPDIDPLSATLTAASRHFPVWVDITLP